MTSPHRLVNPPAMAPAVGFSHAVVSQAGRTVSVAGQIAVGADGAVVGDTFAEQFDVALANVAAALRGAGALPEHVVSVVMFTTDMEGYRSSLLAVGRAYRVHFGRHYPAMALIGATELVDPLAKVEILATAVIPE